MDSPDAVRMLYRIDTAVARLQIRQRCRGTTASPADLEIFVVDGIVEAKAGTDHVWKRLDKVVPYHHMKKRHSLCNCLIRDFIGSVLATQPMPFAVWLSRVP